MRTWILLGSAVVVAAAVGTGAVLLGDGPHDGAAAADDATPPTLVAVEQRDLSRTEELDGTTGHGEARPLVLGATGTLTALPSVGDIIEPGAAIAEVDGQPVIALDGTLPMWRDLGPSVDDGKDVLQLEYLLATLGYAQEHDVTVDEHWTSATTDAVEAFQEDHGQDDDGIIRIGEIVWIDGAVRIDAVAGVVGQDATAAGVEVTGPDQIVRIDVGVEDTDLVPIGTTVDVELPTGETLAGTVTAAGTAHTAEDGTATIPVDVTVDAPDPLPDGMPVDVAVTTVAASDVLIVPVEAVLALAEGGYALEVDDGGATTHLVRVALGVFADGSVAVSGDIAAGDQVVVP